MFNLESAWKGKTGLLATLDITTNLFENLWGPSCLKRSSALAGESRIKAADDHRRPESRAKVVTTIPSMNLSLQLVQNDHHHSIHEDQAKQPSEATEPYRSNSPADPARETPNWTYLLKDSPTHDGPWVGLCLNSQDSA